MASIHKRPGSQFWYGAWRGTNGKLNLRSTKQTDKTKALAFVMELERAERMAASDNGLTETQAREILNDILKRSGTGEGVKAPPATKAYFDAWIKAKENTKAGGTVARYKGVADGFLLHLGPKGAARRLDSITTADIEGFLEKRRKSGVSPGTIALDCKILRAAFGKARREGLITTNPAEGVELAKVRHVERGTFRPDEVGLLVNTAEGEWKTLILLAYYTGQRLGDCCSLEWDSVNFAENEIVFRQQKTDETVTIPMHPDLTKALEKLAGDKPEKYVMPHLATLGPGGRHGLSEGFKRIVTKAGLDLGTAQGYGTRKISRRSFHALRHSFTSALANAGVSSELRMKLTGHKSDAVHQGYTHHEKQVMRDAITKLSSITKGTK